MRHRFCALTRPQSTQGTAWLPDTIAMTQDPLHLQNASLAVTVLPSEGGRVASLRSLRSGVEFLTQSHRMGRTVQTGMNARFQDGPCAGIEECLPSIGASGPETRGGPTPDHGDFWQLAWGVDEAGKEQARLHAQGFSRTLRFTKHLTLHGETLRIRYGVENTGNISQSFLYACHPLLVIDPGDRILLPPEVDSLLLDYSRDGRLSPRGTTIAWPDSPAEPHLDVAKTRDAGTAEMLYTTRLREGRCAIYRAAHRQVLLISFDTSVLPFLGIWLCYGGWPGGAGVQQYAVALEPTTSPHNTLTNAQREGGAVLLKPGAISSWDISFQVKLLR
jgi:galactose mutarotase-like enzyme